MSDSNSNSPRRASRSTKRSLTRRLLAAVMAQRSERQPRRGQLLLECLEGRQMMAGDVELFATAGSLVEPPKHDAAETNSTLDASGLTAEGEAAPDLVAFATALKDAGVVYYGAAWCPFCTEQEELFEDGGRELPFVEVTNPDRSLNQVGIDNDIETFPTWDFPDSTRATGVLSLEELSQRSGVAIPTSETPSFAPIGAKTVRIGSPLHLGVDAYDPNGDPLTVTVSVANPDLLEAVVLQGNRSLRMDVKGYGDMVFELFEQRAERPTSRVIQLANSGFYEDIKFHRVIDNFVLQAGDPTGTGSGGSDLGDFDDQFHPDLQHTSTGTLSFAKSADDTNDSQFFITEGATQHLDFNHSVFGQLVEGGSVREAISETEVDSNDRPTTDVVIDSFTVFNDQENSVIMLKPTGNGTGTTNVTITVTDSDGNSTSEVVPVTIASDNVNQQPYLEDIDPVVAPAGTPATFTLPAVDIEDDPVQYLAEIADDSDATVSVNQSNGQVTVTPPSGYSGEVLVNVGVAPASGVAGATQGQMDVQTLSVTFAAAAPTGINLIDASDSGSSNTDNVTRTASMTFVVSGVTAGSTVELLVDDTVIGVGSASGSTATITTNNIAALGDGTYNITARQRGSNGVNSGESPALQVVYDSTKPAAVNTTIPALANVGALYSVNLGHPDEGSNLTYSISEGPSEASIDPTTGLLEWTPTEAQVGEQTITISLTDAAGNVRAQSFDVTVGDEVVAEIKLGITDLDGNPISSIRAGEEFLLTFGANDARSGLLATSVFAAFADVLFDSDMVEPVSGAEIEYTERFGFAAPSGTIGDGIIDELGGMSSSLVPGNSTEVAIATLRMRATASGQATFTSNPAEGNGTDTLLYYDDSDDDLAVPHEKINYGTASLTVTAAYTATNDSFTVDEDSSNNALDVLANDEATAGENTTLTLVSVGTPGDGEASISNGQVIYTPDDDFFGTDTFTYVVKDQDGSQQTATVTVTVTGKNDPPTAVADSFSVAKNSGQTRLDVLANDSDGPDADETLTITAVGSTSNGGTVAIVSNGSAVRYTPASGFTGTDSFTYTVSDGTTTRQATVNVAVGATNAPPTAANDSFTVAEDYFDADSDPESEAEFDVLDNDSTSDSGESIALDSVGTPSKGGTARLSDDGSKLFYVPAENFFGTETVTYTIVDSGGATATATVTFTVTGVNDPPPSDDITQTVLTGSEDTTVITLNDIGTNVDGNESVTITEVGSTSAGGTVEIASNGKSVTYTPPSDTFTGEDTFTYTVEDASGEETTGTVTINVRDYVPRSFTVSLDGAVTQLSYKMPGVMLRGTTEFGETIEVAGTWSAQNGTVVFADQAPGDYEIVVPAMPFLAGGENPQVFEIDSESEDGDVDDLVARLGPLLPKYVSARDYLITTPKQSILAAIQPGTESIWVAPSKNMNGLSDPKLSFNDDGSAFELEVKDNSGKTQKASVPINDVESVDLREQLGSMRLVRINISPDAVDYSPGISTSSSSTASATEAEGEGTANGMQAEGEGSNAATLAAPLAVTSTPEGESTADARSRSLAATAAHRMSALDAAFADVADETNRPTSAESMLSDSSSGSRVDSEAIDAFVSLLSDDDNEQRQ